MQELTWIHYYRYIRKLADGKPHDIFRVAPNDPMTFLYHLTEFGKNATVDLKVDGNIFVVKYNILL